mmetsp:Transcript_20989/g.58403  ORF Transcript_20989/g.58403 Transcript_20989/m.58403 type:complete len:296 (-) Transcript_20989:129-1016(-)|eukprot:CAMPEP_0198134502 /NCGR_PEP_ID=MMETSP1442-20131203/60112_1 /TAXON_ID= /ORGANISM="Craspedostauros australis, Strain CCMP3328" /LENGTH=295 /DNA_ID=CAMNT_0043795647 /DNA_START=678 /DNA_END=1565 /DNA_ORIENTATION=-
MRISILVTSLLAATEAFTTPSTYNKFGAVASRQSDRVVGAKLFAAKEENESIADVEQPQQFDAAKMPAITAAFWAITSSAAFAAGPDWGLFEGKTGSLLHPIMMGSLALFSLSTAFLGFQWRRQRTMGDEISDLKKTLPNLGGAASVSEALFAAKSAETPDAARIASLQSALAVESQVEELQKERKELTASKPRDKHFSQGSLLAFLGTCFAIEGPLNTYARAGKLFPGPHLYAGAGLVCLWALALACVPAMQKGDETARKVHIGANVAGIGMFGWQVVSGIPILLKVWEKTQWP